MPTQRLAIVASKSFESATATEASKSTFDDPSAQQNFEACAMSARLKISIIQSPMGFKDLRIQSPAPSARKCGAVRDSASIEAVVCKERRSSVAPRRFQKRALIQLFFGAQFSRWSL